MKTNHPRKPVSQRGTQLTLLQGQSARSGGRVRLLLPAHDAEQLRAAIGTNPLHGRAPVLHGDFLRICHFLLRLALHTISFSHWPSPPLGPNLTWKTVAHITGSARRASRGKTTTKIRGETTKRSCVFSQTVLLFTSVRSPINARNGDNSDEPASPCQSLDCASVPAVRVCRDVRSFDGLRALRSSLGCRS